MTTECFYQYNWYHISYLVTMETNIPIILIVRNNFLKTNIFVTTFLISVKNNLYTSLFVAMVTKFKSLS